MRIIDKTIIGFDAERSAPLANGEGVGLTSVFTKIMEKGWDAQQIHDDYRTLDFDKITCLNCGTPLRMFITESGVFGKLGLFPSLCEKCKYEKFKLPFEKQGGMTKPFIRHCGQIVRYENSGEQIEFQTQFVEYMIAVIENQEKRGAFLYGPVGSGKTHLAKMMHNELVEKGYNCQFWRCVDLMAKLRAEAISENGQGGLQWKLSKCSFLFLDDFGTGKYSEFVSEQFYAILDARYDALLPTIFTSNLRPEEIKKVDFRLASRIQDPKWCAIIPLRGVDLRQNFPQVQHAEN